MHPIQLLGELACLIAREIRTSMLGIRPRMLYIPDRRGNSSTEKKKVEEGGEPCRREQVK